MKRKILLIEILTTIITLLILFVISIVYIDKKNENAAKEELITYSNIACEIFEGDNFSEVNQVFINTNIRITIIDLDGNVIIDSSLENANNHLDREEIENLGECISRYSSSLKEEMMYLATIDNGYYIRLAIPLQSIETFVQDYIVFILIALIIILSIAIILTIFLFNRTLKPIKKEINKLEFALGDEISNEKDFEHLSIKINELTKLLEDKVSSLSKEKEKSKYILDNMNQGLILLDEKGKIKLLNKYALNIFNFENDYLFDKSYLYLFRDLNLQDKIDKCLTKKIESQELIELNDKKYLIYINLLNEDWSSQNETSIALLIVDVTLQENINALKREFFANASHELKSPLTSIIGYQQLIYQGILESKEEIQDATKRTINEAQRMNKLIVEMLDLSRLENNVQTSIEDVDILKIINDSLNELAVLIKKKEIKVQLPSSNLIIKSSASDMYKLIRNIIENAVIYNKQEGEIICSINSKSKKLIIQDKGIGIAKKDLEHIFERFYRVDKNKSKEASGTGLGLSIVKHICLLYGYKIDVKSKLNEGSVFTISFK